MADILVQSHKTQAPQPAVQARSKGVKATPSRRKTASARPPKLEASSSPFDEPSATLASVVEDLGFGVVNVLAAPQGLDRPVGEPIIYDAVAGTPIDSRDIVLAVALHPEDRGALDLVRTAGERGASAVVVKALGDCSSLAAVARESGVALIGVDPEMAWHQLVSLLKTSVARAGHPSHEDPGAARLGDLFALANAVAAMVGGPTTIEDPQSRVLAYSNLGHPIDEARRETILGRQVPYPWVKRLHQEGVFKKLWNLDGIVEIKLPDKGYVRRLAIAVKAGSERLGSIWVAEAGKPLGKEAEAALKEAARIAALHMLRHRSTEDIERRTRGEILRSVLEGRGPTEHLAQRLGLEAKSSFTVIAFELQAEDEAEIALKRERALGLIAAYCETFRRRVACVALDRAVYALLPTPEPQPERLEALAKGIVDQAAEALRLDLKAGIGSTVADLHQVPKSRWQADQVLRCLRADPSSRAVASIDDVRAPAILLHLKDLASQYPELLEAPIQALLDYDAKHKTDLTGTLQAYFFSFGHIAEAAAKLGIHKNTFRYRLKRVTEIGGLDLNDPTERLVAELQIRFLRG